MSHGSSRKRKGGHEEEHESSERWLVTYADMLTLLMVLFVVMFAISQVDIKKFEELKSGLSQSLDQKVKVLDGSSGLLDTEIKPPKAVVSVNVIPATAVKPKTATQQEAERRATLAAAQREVDSLRAARDAMLAALHRHGLDGAAKFRVDERGMEVSIVTDQVLFPPDLASLQPSGRRVLDAIAPALRKLPNDLVVEGHTNTAPVRPRFYPSEWELSTARAVTVLRHLTDQLGLQPRRMAAAGYADQHPRYPQSNPKANKLNRRVEIVVLSALDADGKKLMPTLAQSWSDPS